MWVIIRLQLYAAYLVLQMIYEKILEVYRLAAGTAEIPHGKVRVHSIIWRYKIDPEEIAKRKDFVLTAGYLDSVEILNSAHWTVYTIEKNFVVFVMLPEPVYSYSIAEYPFIFVPMYEKALAVGVVTRDEFWNSPRNWVQTHSRKPCSSPTPRDVAVRCSGKCCTGQARPCVTPNIHLSPCLP